MKTQEEIESEIEKVKMEIISAEESGDIYMESILDRKLRTLEWVLNK